MKSTRSIAAITRKEWKAKDSAFRKLDKNKTGAEIEIPAQQK